MIKKIDSKNFDKSFEKLLEEKRGQNIIKGRIDIESIKLKSKLDFIVHLLLSFKAVVGLTYKILYWENDYLVESLLEPFTGNIFKTISYKNEELPGVIFIDDQTIDRLLLKEILTNHFNYEMAEDPSLNLRVQICVNHENYITLLDIYDDRGFDIYYVECPASLDL